VAIKQIRSEILNPRHVEHEETIHHGLKHPFVARFHCTMKDDAGNVYFVIEYIPGKNLGRRLSRKNKLSKSTVQRYVAEIITALEYIHAKGIVYRDLKASNILISKSDHIKLIDFGLSVYDTKNNLRGFAGTLEYAAPEMAAHRFYGRPVDFYSLGILIFKLVTNRLPLSRHEVGLEKHEFLELVANGFDFPSTGNDVADDLIAHFCDRNPESRWGLDPAYKQLIREHAFFRSFNWNSVSNKADEYEMDSVSSIEFRDAVQLDRLASFFAESSSSSTTTTTIPPAEAEAEVPADAPEQ
jgi:serine/threonine protein kinase